MIKTIIEIELPRPGFMLLRYEFKGWDAYAGEASLLVKVRFIRTYFTKATRSWVKLV